MDSEPRPLARVAPPQHRIVRAGPADAGKVAAALAAAFYDDPVFGWFFPDPIERRRRLPLLFARLCEVELRFGTILCAPTGEAASFWRAPGRAATPPLIFLRHLPGMLGLFGPRIGRMFATARAIEAHMPRAQPFRYAHFVGVRPAAQRSGWGQAMMRAGLNDAAAPRVPLYLETARTENVDFYLRLGFRIIDEWHVPAGPHFWSLLNTPD